MDNIIELLDQDKVLDVFFYFVEKIKTNPSLLVVLFDIDYPTQFTEEDNKTLALLKEINDTKHKWLPDMAADTGFYHIKDDDEHKEIFKKIKDKLSKAHKKKKINLVENEWTDIELVHSEKKLPKAFVSFSFNEENFLIKAEVHDNHFLDGNRSWRYGDGFYMNFTMPEGKEIKDCVSTERFYSLGFSMEEGKPQGVLVNHNGRYFLGKTEELSVDIAIDKEKMIALYEVSIPFSFLKPFNPLVDEISGLYIRYVSQDEDRDSRTQIALIDDIQADSEMSNRKRFVPISYTFAEDSPFKIAGVLDNRLSMKENLKLDLHYYSNEELEEKMLVNITDGKKKIFHEIEKAIKIKKGKHNVSEKINIESLESDTYQISVSIKEKTWIDTFYKYSSKNIEDILKKIKDLKKLDTNPLLESSITTLEYKVQNLEAAVSNFHYRENPEGINATVKEINSLITKCQEDKSIYKQSGYLLAAFKSPFDDSLQPFSFSFPENFNPEKEYHLLVGLHGSGVDEVGFMRFMGKNIAEMKATNLICVGPRGRNLSDGYSGQSENDVVDMLNVVKKMFKINKTIVFGFSMGGYGCWRMSLKHPELFEAAAIVAGYPAYGSKPENDMNNFIDKPNNINYLVIHSDSDRSVSIESTDEFIEKLKTNKFDIEYERLTGMDHGNMDFAEIFAKWLFNYLG
ncbi:MAG: alpha/beta fold hydrolase [Candidatus Heimdallarchaeota archaeon]